MSQVLLSHFFSMRRKGVSTREAAQRCNETLLFGHETTDNPKRQHPRALAKRFASSLESTALAAICARTELSIGAIRSTLPSMHGSGQLLTRENAPVAHTLRDLSHCSLGQLGLNLQVMETTMNDKTYHRLTIAVALGLIMGFWIPLTRSSSARKEKQGRQEPHHLVLVPRFNCPAKMGVGPSPRTFHRPSLARTSVAKRCIGPSAKRRTKWLPG